MLVTLGTKQHSIDKTKPILQEYRMFFEGCNILFYKITNDKQEGRIVL